MSRYLIRRIEDNPAIVAPNAHGDRVARRATDHLERVRWRDNRRDATEPRHQARVRDDGRPSHHGLAGRVRDARREGVHQDRTGPDAATIWRRRSGPSPRPPYLLETSRPGVFAVGDVRAGNVKRVASAVGEGSIAIALVHQALA